MCVGEIISLPWFSKELKNDLSKNNYLRGVILILLIRESIFVGWGSPFPIMLVPRYKLALCHTAIKPDLLGFLGIDVFACWLRDHVITRFTSPSMVVSLLQEFDNVFPEDISSGLPPLKGLNTRLTLYLELQFLTVQPIKATPRRRRSFKGK